jgi:hypothetical protein
MEINDIKKCPNCYYNDFIEYKNYIKCKRCNTKIGIDNDKIWYEFILKNN